MRSREEIKQDGSRADILALEMLLDIRDLLNKFKCVDMPQKKKRGRPKTIK